MSQAYAKNSSGTECLLEPRGRDFQKLQYMDMVAIFGENLFYNVLLLSSPSHVVESSRNRTFNSRVPSPTSSMFYGSEFILTCIFSICNFQFSSRKRRSTTVHDISTFAASSSCIGELQYWKFSFQPLSQLLYTQLMFSGSSPAQLSIRSWGCGGQQMKF